MLQYIYTDFITLAFIIGYTTRFRSPAFHTNGFLPETFVWKYLFCFVFLKKTHVNTITSLNSRTFDHLFNLFFSHPKSQWEIFYMLDTTIGFSFNN